MEPDTNDHGEVVDIGFEDFEVLWVSLDDQWHIGFDTGFQVFEDGFKERFRDSGLKLYLHNPDFDPHAHFKLADKYGVDLQSTFNPPFTDAEIDAMHEALEEWLELPPTDLRVPVKVRSEFAKLAGAQ